MWRLKDLLELIGPAEVAAIPCGDPDVALASIKSEAGRLGYRIACLQWGSAERLGALIDQAVEGLARISLSVWPNWYRSLDSNPGSSAGTCGDRTSPTWRESAERYCLVGQPPLPHGYPAATHAAQLALTLGPLNLAIIMSMADIGRAEATSVLRAAGEWLACNTKTRVFILLNEAAIKSAGLRVVIPCIDLFVPEAVQALREFEEVSPRVDLFPVTGMPHPLSPGEQRLAERVRADDELAPLFAFNQRITGRHGNEYIVDLVWPAGRLIVEVDSFEVHGSRFAFASDRHRDYELMAAEYRVLRITNDEAATDTQSAVEKIRQLVRLVRK